MSEVINLKDHRKVIERTQKEKTASENRRKHGRTKEEKQKEKEQSERLEKHLDSHKRDDEE